MGNHKTIAYVKRIRNYSLAPHRGFLVRADLRDCNARDRQVQGDDWINGSSEGELYWPAHLTAVHFGRHHRAECANVIEVLAHPALRLVDLICLLFPFVYLDIQ